MKIHDTLSSVEQKLDTTKKIKIYLCGVTVYDESHIGHARTIIVFDVLRKYLESKGIEIDLVQNFTDVDDKIINRANSENTTAEEISTKYIKNYFKDFDELNVKRATNYPKATEHIKEIIEFIEKLIKKQMAYPSKNGVYFSVSKFSEYGKLSKKKIDELQSGSRIEIDESKKDPLDFAIWKFSDIKPVWESPWGKGRPGWHIECSAMINALLGEEIDFHCGGNDLIFPHHENELAQSKAAKPNKNFVKYWLHNGMINLSGKKMSKSEGNVKILKDYIDDYSGDVMRFYFLRAQYRSPQEFTEDLLIESRTTFKKISEFVEDSKSAPIDKNLLHIFEACMGDDLNTPKLIGEIFIQINQSLTLEEEELQNLRSTVRFIFDILGFTFTKGENEKLHKDKLIKFFEEYKIIFETIEQAMSEFINIREKYRLEREYKIADEMRNKLLEIGIKIEDGKKDGWSWNNN